MPRYMNWLNSDETRARTKLPDSDTRKLVPISKGSDQANGVGYVAPAEFSQAEKDRRAKENYDEWQKAGAPKTSSEVAKLVSAGKVKAPKR